MGGDLGLAGMVAAEDDLSWRHALPATVERELEDHASLHPGPIGLGSGTVTEAQALVYGECGGACNRHHDRELGLNLEVTRMELHAGPEHRHALIERAPPDASASGFEQAGESG